VVSSVTVKNAIGEQTDADHDELLERGTAMFDGLYAVLKQKT
jgi:hypothetical protein